MSCRVRQSLMPLFLLLLVIILINANAVNAQTRTGVATAAHIDFGTVGRGGSAERDVILTNPGNNSTLVYSINFTNVTSTSGQLTATPTSGTIGPKSNVTVTVRLDVPSDANEGDFSSNLVVNSTAQNTEGNTTALPARFVQVTYTVQGNLLAQLGLTDVDVPLAISVLGIFMLVAIVAAYIILKR